MENSIAYFVCCLMIILLLMMNASNSSDRPTGEGLLLELPNVDKLDTAIDNVLEEELDITQLWMSVAVIVLTCPVNLY
jgi:hypothetical protein